MHRFDHNISDHMLLFVRVGRRFETHCFSISFRTSCLQRLWISERWSPGPSVNCLQWPDIICFHYPIQERGEKASFRLYTLQCGRFDESWRLARTLRRNRTGNVCQVFLVGLTNCLASDSISGCHWIMIEVVKGAVSSFSNATIDTVTINFDVSAARRCQRRWPL